MHQLTVHDIDDELYAALERAAQQQGVSVNEYVIDALKQSVRAVNGASEQHKYHDLDFLAGTWTEEEFQEFEQAVQHLRKIDWEMWQ